VGDLFVRRWGAYRNDRRSNAIGGHSNAFARADGNADTYSNSDADASPIRSPDTDPNGTGR
jgi:hypothetical protein